MRFPRSSGILLHPTSLPGPWGIGDLGVAAYQFVDFLVEAGQSLWQILPLGPIGYGNSPYQCFSAFAGNPLLISLDSLVADGLLDAQDVHAASTAVTYDLNPDRVNYHAATALKLPLLRRTYERFRDGNFSTHAEQFGQYCAENADWLDDYALFMALREHYGDVSWCDWDQDIATRKAAALKRWTKQLAEPIAVQKFVQYLFSNQWRQLKAYANEQGVQIIGDAPIFVAYDSSDVWANPKLFYLDNVGQPTVVAGVPPDYFSAVGQRWGNPLYRWDRMARNDYTWWVARLRVLLSQVDIARIDHFRGFEAYWEIPAEEETAINGRWVPGPGAALFEKLERELGEVPIIAEDLGVITPEVEALRDQFHMPGMKVLQFAFGDTPANPYLPHNYTNNCIVYTGTHDNDTTAGWFNALGSKEREATQRYLGRDGSDISWDLIRLALSSVADAAIIPLQDVLRLGSDGRMNVPGYLGDNWSWRFRAEMLDPGLGYGLRIMTETYGRLALVDETSDEDEPEA